MDCCGMDKATKCSCRLRFIVIISVIGLALEFASVFTQSWVVFETRPYENVIIESGSLDAFNAGNDIRSTSSDSSNSKEKTYGKREAYSNTKINGYPRFPRAYSAQTTDAMENKTIISSRDNISNNSVEEDVLESSDTDNEALDEGSDENEGEMDDDDNDDDDDVDDSDNSDDDDDSDDDSDDSVDTSDDDSDDSVDSSDEDVSDDDAEDDDDTESAGDDTDGDSSYNDINSELRDKVYRHIIGMGIWYGEEHTIGLDFVDRNEIVSIDRAIETINTYVSKKIYVSALWSSMRIEATVTLVTGLAGLVCLIVGWRTYAENNTKRLFTATAIAFALSGIVLLILIGRMATINAEIGHKVEFEKRTTIRMDIPWSLIVASSGCFVLMAASIAIVVLYVTRRDKPRLFVYANNIHSEGSTVARETTVETSETQSQAVNHYSDFVTTANYTHVVPYRPIRGLPTDHVGSQLDTLEEETPFIDSVYENIDAISRTGTNPDINSAEPRCSTDTACESSGVAGAGDYKTS